MDNNNPLIKLYYKFTHYEKVRFIVVGGIGFVVNFIGLTVFYHLLKINIVVSQIVAAELAVIATFFGNNFWTFKFDHHHTVINKLVRYHVSALGGIVINDALVILLVRNVHLYYGLALVIGSAVALLWNYTMYKKVVFKPSKVNKNKKEV